jgi:hypothetical protein
VVPEQNAAGSLEPLDIKCTSSDCENGLHCFRATRRLVRENLAGQCRYCGASLVDWTRVQGRNIADVEYTFSSLRLEMIRHHFWHVDIDQRAINYAVRRGRLRLREAVETRVTKHLGPSNPPFDGRQTPLAGSGNPVTYAQHGVAACCRKCVEYWHGIPRGRALSDAEIRYLSSLVMLFLEERLPEIEDEGRAAPRVPRASPD